MSVKIITPEFRVAFPSVFKASAFEEGQEPKYDLVALFPSGTNLNDLKTLAQNAAKDKWGDRIPKDLRSPFNDGNARDYDGYADTTWCRLSSKRRPGLVDKDVNPILEQSEFYGGCWARATITAYAYGGPGTKIKPGVAFGLQNIQKLRDDEPFGDSTTPEEDFGPATTKSDASTGVTEAAGSLFD